MLLIIADLVTAVHVLVYGNLRDAVKMSCGNSKVNVQSTTCYKCLV